jgi:ketopantoate hydroxymethyltransferase
VKSKYKQLKSNCWSARYSKNDMAPTIANQMKRFAEEIEAEVFPEQNK